jgi:hypothetical protein
MVDTQTANVPRRVEQCLLYVAAHRHKFNWYTEGGAIRGQIKRGKFRGQTVCPVTGAYFVMFNLYHIAGLMGLTKPEAGALNLACDDADTELVELRELALQTLIYNDLYEVQSQVA